jgi:hypothetical protein
MKLSIKALGLAGGILWGSAILLVGLMHWAVPAYGVSFLQMVTSVYPGFHVSAGLAGVAIGTIYGFLDGAFAGGLLAWLYNKLSQEIK